MKIKKTIASVMAAVLLTTAISVSASADRNELGNVGGLPVYYRSKLTASSSNLSGGPVGDPLLNDYKLGISAYYIYKNTSTGISDSASRSVATVDDYNSLSYTPPKNCDLKSVEAYFYFNVNGATKTLNLVDSV